MKETNMNTSSELNMLSNRSHKFMKACSFASRFLRIELIAVFKLHYVAILMTAFSFKKEEVGLSFRHIEYLTTLYLLFWHSKNTFGNEIRI